MNFQENFKKIKCSKCELIEWCKAGTYTNYNTCYRDYLESLLGQMLEALKKLRQHGKEASKVCEMGIATYEIANNAILQVGGKSVKRKKKIN